ncbi:MULTISPECIES: helix-turn-helix transcriptional regulator [unclassified Mesorhizobium]|uniref:helix-turn-helix domain-containing protein n=1 Tax=unclassified Mesorhizobium TaxID=325217 RepID=UPI000FCCD9C3|nr:MULTISPECIES: helix-turn-helix transcriptional regulator [unclassified Mesorhizobium]TGP34035.1 XRE family transcriptional regulator [Mesorhizobium sp. M2D.F.Ca.ET.232.01.1.1]TGQ23818.1 XRE family transcriptional regulator [Mesorhizobium sp. M00.F.Ca.ET.220.01.1.1]TGT96022.1 XRE family transcriptional regulator [bacterium M00.F.Ca.ET.163.01.1.1]
MPKPVRLLTKPRAKAETFDPSKPSELKIHYIGEWMEHREKSVKDMVEALDLSTPSQVYRWLKGQKPHNDELLRIAAFLETEPESLLRHPLDDWMTRFFRGRSEEEKKAIVEMMQKAWGRTGTSG